MKKSLIAALVAGASLMLAANANADTQMQRLYNPNSGEHFYTADTNEKTNLVSVGWSYEGIGWVAPDSGDPVYRLYNPNAGDHHYTKDTNEKDNLIAAGWRYEGVSWYSGGSVPLYRAYNPNAKAGSHNYTANVNEQSNLLSVGWNNEGISWYGIAGGSSVATPPTSNNTAGTVTQEMKNAVATAQQYQNAHVYLSLLGMIDQLEYEGFSTSDATYGANNAGIDWSKNALESAKIYYFRLGLSKSDTYYQLISVYGDQYTTGEAQHAVDSLG
ncbi:Ltp family lipoprotein [Lactovum odontotermitis]